MEADTGTVKNLDVSLTYTPPTSTSIYRESNPNIAIPDDTYAQSTNDAIMIPADGVLETISVLTDIEHTYIGDLKVLLVSPQGDQIVLHDKTGGGTDNIKTTYASTSHTGLASLIGTDINGDWTISVGDYTSQDTGTLKSWSINMTYGIPLPSNAPIIDTSNPNVAIPDNTGTQSTNNTIVIQADGFLETISVSPYIEHTYIGDLRVVLVSPQGDQIVLHDKTGGGTDNIKTTYTSTSHTGLASLIGADINGDWTISVGDYASQDTGTLKSWTINMTYGLHLPSNAPIIDTSTQTIQVHRVYSAPLQYKQTVS